MDKEKLASLLIGPDATVKQAMKQMDKIGQKSLFVVNQENILQGSLTDGDIRRWILKGGSLEENVNNIGNKNPVAFAEGYDVEHVKKIMLVKKIEHVPVINGFKQVVEVLLWEDVFAGHISKPKEKLNLPVVIMAGGKGVRLDPFTSILPKPLIPIKGKPIIEIIMDEFNEYQINAFYVSVNHKSGMIKAYFGDVATKYKIEYLEEDSPLGTAGGLKFLQDKIQGSFVVTNCDIIIKSDYCEIYDYHRENQNDITIVGSLRQYVIPYGVCDIENGGILREIREKPEYDFLVGTGFYILESRVLKYIPKNEPYSMTDLIKKITKENGKVRVFPISAESWIDVGQWDEYKRAREKMQ